jgi:hypothetical protein
MVSRATLDATTAICWSGETSSNSLSAGAMALAAEVKLLGFARLLKARDVHDLSRQPAVALASAAA